MATSNEDEDKPLVFCRGCRVAFKGEAPEDELHDNGGHCADLYERALLLDVAAAGRAYLTARDAGGSDCWTEREALRKALDALQRNGA